MADILEAMLKLEGRRQCVCGQPLVVRVASASLSFFNPGSENRIYQCPGCDAHLGRHTVKPQEGDCAPPEGDS